MTTRTLQRTLPNSITLTFVFTFSLSAKPTGRNARGNPSASLSLRRYNINVDAGDVWSSLLLVMLSPTTDGAQPLRPPPSSYATTNLLDVAVVRTPPQLPSTQLRFYTAGSTATAAAGVINISDISLCPSSLRSRVHRRRRRGSQVLDSSSIL
nr:hypothetical protein Iba_chr01cCG4850 [Ipomoea batatas]GME01966.1 hypothetical protein Iba_contig3402CG0010 [Ipomoea batatas]